MSCRVLSKSNICWFYVRQEDLKKTTWLQRNKSKKGKEGEKKKEKEGEQEGEEDRAGEWWQPPSHWSFPQRSPPHFGQQNPLKAKGPGFWRRWEAFESQKFKPCVLETEKTGFSLGLAPTSSVSSGESLLLLDLSFLISKMMVSVTTNSPFALMDSDSIKRISFPPLQYFLHWTLTCFTVRACLDLNM